MKRDTAPRELSDDEYDAEGWPRAKVRIELRSYSLMLGPSLSWVADLEGLPGYYGEGATVEQALQQLRDGPYGLGPPPHYRVTLSPEDLRERIIRKWAVKAAALRTRPPGRPDIRGDDVGAAAYKESVRKALVTEERAKLFEQLFSPDGRPVLGLSRESLDLAAHVASEHSSIELWVAEQAPWRIEHAAARELFPK